MVGLNPISESREHWVEIWNSIYEEKAESGIIQVVQYSTNYLCTCYLYGPCIVILMQVSTV